MLLIITLGILTALAFTHFWGKLRDWLNTRLRPWLARKFGEKFGEKFGDFLSWLDEGVTMMRKFFRGIWRFFKERVLRMKRTYTRNPDQTVTNDGQTIIRDEHGNFIKITETKIEPWEDLPGSIRREMIRQQTNTAEIDEMEVLERKTRERAEAEGFGDEMVMEY